MDTHRSRQLWEQEQAIIAQLRQSNPELFTAQQTVDQHEILEHIGISTIPPGLPEGYIRFRQEDFIVEEIGLDGSVSTVDPSSAPDVIGQDRRTIYADMIKVGLGTTEALDRLCHAADIKSEQVAYAGLKDAGAITSQKISIRGAPIERLRSIHPEAVLLKNFVYGSGACRPGQLQGNRFTLTIRTKEPISQTDLDQRVRQAQQGVLNYYGPQRFGARFSDHFFGRLILRGDFAGAVKSFLTSTNATEAPYVLKIRQQAEQAYGHWSEARTAYEQLPYTLQREWTVAHYLEEHPEDWIGALNAVPQQTQFSVYAYTSWLVNIMLSQLLNTAQAMPETIPIPFSTTPSDLALYQSLLDRDEIPNPINTHLRPFRFLRPQSRQLQTLIKPHFHGAVAVDVGAVLAFDLPAGAYATTVLMLLFTILSHEGTQTWIRQDQLDSLLVVGLGSTAPIRQAFTPYLNTKFIAE